MQYILILHVIGYLPIPVGKVGPLLLDGHSHYVPLATTEGCLVASTNRGCRALFLAGGVKSVLTIFSHKKRHRIIWRPQISSQRWTQTDHIAINHRCQGPIEVCRSYRSTSVDTDHAMLQSHRDYLVDRRMFQSILYQIDVFPFPVCTSQVISLSGNMCTDKKPAAINSILGRGKSVIAEAQLPATVLAQVLHTTATRLTRLAHAKNWTGSAMAGCPGMMGSNAHAANIVAGIFAATGQDLAQVVDASACLTQFEIGDNNSLVATVTMPCMEVGTIGGGTRLPAQRSCLDLLDLSVDRPTEHLARIIAGTVLAGELSLMAALDTDDLVNAHLRLNRALAQPTPSNSTKNNNSSDANVNTGESAVAAGGTGVSSGTLWISSSIPVPVKSSASNGAESSHPTM
ncbi:unnamed protein product [Echinostoma caproni]|uniref:hydroxymethylglutaryl-CoA reductase (NADPH) n=1 Tax=Echinostoma caproni TaxID=27848 RepID=A0A3P8F2B5_9TREM|nr:unnamed protein product [Echinostoma caproni]